MQKIQKSVGRFFIAFALVAAIELFNVSFAQYQSFIPPPPRSVPTTDGSTVTPTSLPAPRIISPKNGKVVSSDKVILQWTEVPGATAYSIEMSFRQPDWTDFITSGVPVGDSTTTSYEYSLKDIPNGTKIRWLVSARNDETGQGGWVSEEGEFVYQKSTKQKKSTPKNAAELKTLKKKITKCEQKSSFDAMRKCLKPLAPKISKACKKTGKDCTYLNGWLNNIPQFGIANGLSVQDLFGNIFLGIDNLLQGKNSGPVF